MKYYDNNLKSVRTAQTFVRNWLIKQGVKKLKLQAQNLETNPIEANFENIFLFGNTQLDYIQ